MKKFIVLLSVLTMAFSCSEDSSSDLDLSEVSDEGLEDDQVADGSANSNLYGVWELVEYSYDGTYEDLDDCRVQSNLTITSNSISRTKIYMDENGECLSDAVDSFSYSINGSTVVVSEGGAVSYSLDGSMFLVSYSEYNEDGVEIDVEESYIKEE